MTQEANFFGEMIVNLMKEMSDGADFSNMLNEETLQEFYTMAYSLYRDKHYTDASCFFRMLLVGDSCNPKYWKGLGACLQMKSEHQEAINCYICSQQLNREQPDPHLYIHAADCYFALGQTELGLKALDAALLSGQEQMNARVINHVTLMKQFWSKETK